MLRLGWSLGKKNLSHMDKIYLSALLLSDCIYCMVAKPFIKNQLRPANIARDFCLKIGMPWKGCIPKGSTLEPVVWMYALGQVPKQDDFLRKKIEGEKNKYTIIDVGAYIGAFFLNFIKCRNIQKYICIEPSRKNFSTLSLNMKSNLS